MIINNISRAELKTTLVSESESVLIQIANTINQIQAHPSYYFATFKVGMMDDEFNSPPELPCLQILAALKFAKENNYNVVVQCDAGKSRSAAVAKYASERLGYTHTNKIEKANIKIYEELINHE